MCSVIKMQNNYKKVQMKVSSGLEEIYSDFISDEEILEEKLKEQFELGYQTAINELGKKYSKESEQKIFYEKQQFASLLSSIDKEMQEYETKFSEMVVTVALSMAKKILKQEIDSNSPLLENISSVSQKMLGANFLVIKANPEEIETIKDNSNNLFAEGNFSKIKFEEDPRIDKGGFLIESDIGSIDGQISSQLNEIKKAIGNLTEQNG